MNPIGNSPIHNAATSGLAGTAGEPATSASQRGRVAGLVEQYETLGRSTTVTAARTRTVTPALQGRVAASRFRLPLHSAESEASDTGSDTGLLGSRGGVYRGTPGRDFGSPGGFLGSTRTSVLYRKALESESESDYGSDAPLNRSRGGVSRASANPATVPAQPLAEEPGTAESGKTLVPQSGMPAAAAGPAHVAIDIDTKVTAPLPGLAKAAQRLHRFYQKKLQAEATAPQAESSAANQDLASIQRKICKQTFVVEGMAVAAENVNRPDARITYADIEARIDQDLTAAGAPGENSYRKLFSDHAQFAEGSVDARMYHDTAIYQAYEEVLASADLRDHERNHIQLSFAVFKESVRTFVADQHAALAGIPEGHPDRPQLQANLDRAKKVEDLVMHKEVRQDLRDKQTAVNIGWGMLGAVPAQALASLLHFGYAKTSVDKIWKARPEYDPADWTQSVALRGSVMGAVLGSADWAVTQFVRPTATRLSEMLGGRPVVPVDPASVYPDAPRMVVENGVPRELTAEEHAQAQAAVTRSRNSFAQAQNAYKIGAIGGDMMGHIGFAVPHFARVMLDNVGTFSAASVHAVAGASAIGGGAMAAAMTHKQLSQTVDGIPTHQLGEPKGWQPVKDSLAKGANLLDSGNTTELLSKVTGAVEGTELLVTVDKVAAAVGLSGTRLRLAKAALAAAEPVAVLLPIFANATSTADTAAAKARGAVTSDWFPRTQNALQGMTSPIEKPHQFFRHGLQLVPQAIVDGINLPLNLLQNGITSAGRAGMARLRQPAPNVPPGMV